MPVLEVLATVMEPVRERHEQPGRDREGARQSQGGERIGASRARALNGWVHTLDHPRALGG